MKMAQANQHNLSKKYYFSQSSSSDCLMTLNQTAARFLQNPNLLNLKLHFEDYLLHLQVCSS